MRPLAKTATIFTLCAFATLCALTLAAQEATYPAPYPRPTAKSILQNDRVNIWDVTWPKGYATPMHEHSIDQLSITLVPGVIRLTTPGHAPTESSSKYASVTFVRHGTVHQEEGMSDIPQHKIMLEVKPSTTASAQPTSPAEPAVKLLDNDRLTAWDLTWPVGQPIQRPATDHDTITVFLQPGTLHTAAGDKAVAAGDVIYTAQGAPASTEQATTGTPRAIIVQLK